MTKLHHSTPHPMGVTTPTELSVLQIPTQRVCFHMPVMERGEELKNFLYQRFAFGEAVQEPGQGIMKIIDETRVHMHEFQSSENFHSVFSQLSV